MGDVVDYIVQSATFGILGPGEHAAPLTLPEPKEPEAPAEDTAALKKLAAQRRSLYLKRQGRRSLRIDPIRNPAIASQASAGLRIP